MKRKPVLAIISPNQNAYSETFIQAHKNIPGVIVRFYFGGFFPTALEGKGSLMPKQIYKQLYFRAKVKLFRRYNLHEKLLMRSFTQEKIECVLAEFGPTAVAVLPACQKLKLPLIVHFHGFDASINSVLQEYEEGYKAVFDYATAVISVSSAMTKMLLNIGCPQDKLVQNTCGPANDFLELNPALNTTRFIGIGRFVDKKAPYYTIFAFADLVKKYPNASLIIAGDGPLHNMCTNLVNHLGLKKNILLPGVISPEQFRSYLEQSVAFVQHSITADNGDMEGTPVAVLEASAAGLPVISTFHAGIPDVIMHDETGLLVEEHDVEGMSNYMIHLLENPNKAIKMGTKGKAHIRDNFSLDRHLNTISELVKKAVDSK
jgi:colanic acid/amylovoran biosynthesis glycosyltransferase